MQILVQTYLIFFYPKSRQSRHSSFKATTKKTKLLFANFNIINIARRHKTISHHYSHNLLNFPDEMLHGPKHIAMVGGYNESESVLTKNMKIFTSIHVFTEIPLCTRVGLRFCHNHFILHQILYLQNRNN